MTENGRETHCRSVVALGELPLRQRPEAMLNEAHARGDQLS
jgi:hypothetical protein